MRLALLRALLRGCLFATLLGSASLPARGDDCVAWTGEPRPLPQLDDPDPQRARWAELRAYELALRAQALEPQSPAQAHQAWRRVLCIDPANESAHAGVQRSLPLKVHRPAVSLATGAEPVSPTGAEAVPRDTDVWTALDAPLAVAPAARGRSPRGAPGSQLALDAPLRAESVWRIERSLGAAEAQVEAARFDEALETVAKARVGLAALPSGRDLHASRLRLEVVAATAEAASGRNDEARACLARVLALDPGFRFDPSTTSPKLVRLLDAARAGQQASQ